VPPREPTRYREMPIISKSGKHLTLLLSATLRSSRSGKWTGVIFVGQDVTELTQYRESLEKMVQQRTIKLKEAIQKEKQAVDMKSKFVSMVSHEFKTPLDTMRATIEKASDSLAAKDLNLELLHTQLSIVNKQIDTMRGMLDEVLEIEKGEVPKIKPVKHELSVSHFAHKVAEEILIASRGTHQINVNLKLAHDLAYTDEKLWRNIFLNLLGNAVKFSPGQTKVEFHIADHDDDITFEVIDEGLGIPESDLSTLFEPFHRSQNVDHIAGTGLGLSIVKRAVDVLGGDISVESVAGVGSTFRVTLPRRTRGKTMKL
jgi:signal transduction histidine kinase